jgi:hypothetical protein
VAATVDVLARELGWDTARTARETAEFDAGYPAF